MNELKVFENSEFGQVRTVDIGGKTYFVANDVAKSLGYAETAKAVRTHCKGVSEMDIPTNGGIQKMKVIPEGDIYRLVIKSQLPSAERFESWIFDEVIPSIRKHGMYAMAELSTELQMLQGLLNQMVDKELADKERDKQIVIAQETANKAVQTTEQIKEEIIAPFDNWRNDINTKVKEIAIKAQIPYQTLFSEMYKELEMKAGCDLSVRQRNKRERMKNGGSRKTDIDKETTKLAIIEDDKRLKQIFDDIVRKYAVKYVA